MPVFQNRRRNIAGGSDASYNTITSTSQLEDNVGATKYLLRPGTYYFDTGGSSPFILDKPFELDDSTGGTIEIIANLFYVGSGTVFNQAIGNQLILRLTGTVLIGAATAGTGTESLFNLTYSATGPNPIILFDFVQAVNWISLGSLIGFDTIVINNYSDRGTSAGLTLIDTVSLISMGPVNIQDAAASTAHFTINSATPGVAIQASQVQFQAATNNEFAFSIAPAVQPNASIQNSVFDPNGQSSVAFYDPVGLDQTSIFLISKGVKNVIDSSVMGVAYYNGTTTPLTCPIFTQDQWVIFNGTPATSPALIIDSEERVDIAECTAGGRMRYDITSLDTFNVDLSLNFSFRTTAATPDFQAAIFNVEATQNATVDPGTDVITTATSHGYINNDIVWLGDSDAVPGAINISALYYVINATSNTFQISVTVGGGAVDMTTTGTNVRVRRCVPLKFSPRFTVDSIYYLLGSASVSTTITTGDTFFPCIRNTTGTQSANVISLQMRITG